MGPAQLYGFRLVESYMAVDAKAENGQVKSAFLFNQAVVIVYFQWVEAIFRIYGQGLVEVLFQVSLEFMSVVGVYIFVQSKKIGVGKDVE